MKKTLLIILTGTALLDGGLALLNGCGGNAVTGGATQPGMR